MVAESLAQRLRLPRTPASVAIYGIGGQYSGVARGRVSLTVASRTSGSSFGISALVFPRLTIYSGTADTASRSWTHLEGLELADPDYFRQDPVELLLGADAYAHIALPGLHRGGPQEPIAQQTQLGWIILGAVGAGNTASTLTSLQCSSCDELPALVRRFWEQEEPPRAPLPLTADEQECEDHFAASHSRTTEGRYQVRLPFRGEPPDLSATNLAALRMMSVVERRFLRDRSFRDRYCAFMAEYASLGHMTKATSLPQLNLRRGCFLPHHGVLRGSGSEAKMRVVFNGSSPVVGGSLNASLHAGPNLLPSLADLVTRWRRHRYVISTDIEKMYRQVLVHPEDRYWQRIWWKDGEKTNEYQLNTVTYGLASAPYLAMRVLRQLAADEGAQFPLGSEALTTDTYMDDIVSGAPTLEKALGLRVQLERLCMAGGFPLRKWSANHAELLEGIPLEHQAKRGVGDFLASEDQAVLGLRWDSDRDCFALIVRATTPSCATKRSLLSGTAKLFDPLGWIAPVVVGAKILFQATWLQQLKWDDPLSSEDAAAWAKLETELPLLEEVRIPRWLRCDSTDGNVEIHGFSDASERAFAAVVYLRVVDAGQVSTSLLMAKTKVAPLKQVSLPRLELCAATLLARLTAHVAEVLLLKSPAIHLWTDSTVTLGWIRGHPAKWTTFVANRVADIQRTVADGQWHHVPGSENPADCASRGMSPSELLAHRLWWRGPDFLFQDRSQWPIELKDASHSDLPERRRAERCLATSRAQEPEELTRFSSLNRLTRVTAWMLRWRTRVTARNQERPDGTAALSPEELEFALTRWLQLAQSWAYPAEIESIREGRPSLRRDSLRRLNPLLDGQGLLRVGGRIKHSLLSEDQRHPLILPPDSHLAHLIVDDGHRRTLHGGVQATLALIRQRYWLPRGRQLVRRCVLRCPTCVRWRAASPQPPMGSLPRTRITPCRPFLHTGVDFAGPILLRTTRGRGHKAYKAFLSVFVCFSSRAIHLEVVSDYTAESFLAALRRFMARRGLCHTIYSDCGTNFVGADSQLRSLFLPASQEVHRIVGRLAVDGVRWRFNPPAAPHFGGLWEAGVKAVKHHLRRVVGETTLTFEEMSTFLAEVEACLNSRPLQALSDDPEDLEVLTPGHFLVGAPLNAVPEPSLLDVPPNRLSRWRLLQSMRDHWWQRWSLEYVQSLIPRPKWWSATRDLHDGQLCLLRSESTPPSRWPLARIVRRYFGDDGEVRVVDVRTRSGILKRPVVKLVPLPSFEEETARVSSDVPSST